MALTLERQSEACSTPAFDFYNCDMHFSDKQKALRQEVRDFVDIEVLPKINPYWESGRIPLGDRAQQWWTCPLSAGCSSSMAPPAWTFVEMGLVMYELGKGDGSISTFYGVHSGLAMGSIGYAGR